MSCGLSLGWAQAGPKPSQRLRLQIQQARALQSQALAAAFRLSRAGTSLPMDHDICLGSGFWIGQNIHHLDDSSKFWSICVNPVQFFLLHFLFFYFKDNELFIFGLLSDCNFHWDVLQWGWYLDIGWISWATAQLAAYSMMKGRKPDHIDKRIQKNDRDRAQTCNLLIRAES